MQQRWWEKDEVAFRNLIGGLTQMNRRTEEHAIDNQYRRLIHALMQFASGYSDAAFGRDTGEAKKIRDYVGDCAAWALSDDFIHSDQFRRLAEFKPMIANDECVRRLRERFRRLELTPSELGPASEAHAKLMEAAYNFKAHKTQKNRKEAGRCLGALLYVIRCNLDHSEKTPYGPDVKKSQRDLAVLSVSFPVLEALVLRTLDAPNHRLAVYGTLRRGQPNHAKIEDLGEPLKGSIEGNVTAEFEFPIFSWSLEASRIPVEVYESNQLTSMRWRSLDAFEGGGYRRIYVPVRLANEKHVVATVYADART